MTEGKYKTPHVHEAMANILKHLSVDKAGTLPGNMGGKPYITAVDTSAEVKRQFVENELIFLPDEEVLHHENIVMGDRSVKITIVVKGSYTFISTKDGSRETVSGTGDGLANGTAVASNIASTNALKNALLRTFLITEQSVEDEAKTPTESKAAPSRAVTQAKAVKPKAAGNGAELTKVKDHIRGTYLKENPKAAPEVKKIVDTVKAEGKIKDEVEIYKETAERLGVPYGAS